MNIQDLQQITKNFTQEMKDAAEGKKTSFPFIKNTLPSQPLIEKGHTFQAMSVGGTNFKRAMVKKNGRLEIIRLEQFPQPPVFETKEDLLSFVAYHLEEHIEYVALNFAFPMKPVFRNNKLEGILLSGTKEHTFTGLVGENICEEIEKYVYTKMRRKISVSAANDTICLLLSGLTLNRKTPRLAAGIVGTGLNFGIFLDDKTAINMEAANFDKFPQSTSGKIIDESSVIKGHAIYEKEVSGAYLHQHYNIQANDQGLEGNLKNTKELSYLASEKKETPEVLLAREILKVSAQFASCAIAGITNLFEEDITFAMVGSIFWNGYDYKDTVNSCLKELTSHKVIFANIEDSDILGAAKLIA